MIALLVGIIVGVVALLAASFVALVHPAGERLACLLSARRTFTVLSSYARSVGFLPKLKIVFSFYGIATSLDEVYNAQMPSAYTAWVNVGFGWAQINWVSSLPPEVLAP